MRSADLARVVALAGAFLLTSGAAYADHDRKPGARSHTVAKKARKAPAPKAVTPEAVPVKPSEDGDFTYALKNMVKAKSSAFCERYSGAGDCIQDIEICLTMLDQDDDMVRVCMTMVPADQDKPRTASAR